MNTTNKESKIYNLIILDESGSMCCIERQALNGLNETLQTIRSAQQKYPEQKQYVSILPFDTNNLRLLRDKVSIDEVRDLRPDEYNPCGGTPLYDAIGFGINSLIKTVTPDDSVLVTIITDGEENSSVEYNAKSLPVGNHHPSVHFCPFHFDYTSHTCISPLSIILTYSTGSSIASASIFPWELGVVGRPCSHFPQSRLMIWLVS